MTLLPTSSIVCNPFNLDGSHSRMEMLLSSIFDGSYSRDEKFLVADNGTIEYKYMKGPTGNSMSVRIISLNIPREKFIIRFPEGQKPFPTSRKLIDHPLLDLTYLT